MTIELAGGDAATNRTALSIETYSSPYHSIKGPGEMTFAPITSALILGEREAVLVDAQMFTSDVDAVGDMIERSGRTLKAIFITHGHYDHYFGADRLAARFPGARIVAAPRVVDFIRERRDADIPRATAMFADGVEVPTGYPEPLDGDVIDLEGHALRVIEVGQGDVAPSTILWVPGPDAAIVGDVAYNRIHMMLAISGPSEWSKWIDSIHAVATLRPKSVVTGHRLPGVSDDDVDMILAGSARYIEDFTRLSATADTAEDLVRAMLDLYPDHGNRTTLVVSAGAAIKARQAAAA